MKRSLIAVAWVLLLSPAVSPSIAQESGRSGYGINNPTRGFYSIDDSEARQRFLDDTVELRRSLVVKQAEFNALKAKKNTDPKIAGKLAKEIFDMFNETPSVVLIHVPPSNFHIASLVPA